MEVVDVLFANLFAVEIKLDLGSICGHSHVNKLSLDEVPVGENVNKGSFFIIGPLGSIDKCAVLGVACGIILTEVAVLGAVWGRLADVVKACPDKLTCAVFSVTVGDNAGFGIFRSPAGS